MCLILFYVCEAVELVIIFMGFTIFLNKLSIFRKQIVKIEIFFHSIAILILSWFMWQNWEYSTLWGIWAVGG